MKIEFKINVYLRHPFTDKTTKYKMISRNKEASRQIYGIENMTILVYVDRRTYYAYKHEYTDNLWLPIENAIKL